jgi:Holliday junction resolvasome RuvABC endonuclease subunit
MLTAPRGSSPIVAIIGIDPGSTHLGVAVLKFNTLTSEIVHTEAWTLDGGRLKGKNNWLEEIHGARTARIEAMGRELLNTFYHYQPVGVASESPFINSKFPMSGLVLTEVLSEIRNAVMDYDSWQQLHMVPPSSVKNAVSAPGNANKEVMKEKVAAIPILNYAGNVPLKYLDEHSIDAIAVVFSLYRKVISREIRL